MGKQFLLQPTLLPRISNTRDIILLSLLDPHTYQHAIIQIWTWFRLKLPLALAVLIKMGQPPDTMAPVILLPISCMLLFLRSC